MKKRFAVLAAVLSLSLGVVTGCSSTQAEPATTGQTETVEEVTEKAAEETSEETKEGMVGMANPWVEITEEEANTLCTRLFKAPEGAEVQAWLKCEDLGHPDKGVGPMVQLSFSMDETNFTARAQQGVSEDTDISGNYVQWTVGPEDVTLANWGGGNMTGKTYRSINDTGYVDMITWYDMEIGISYSLTATAKDLEGFDIQAIAEQMYEEGNEPYANMPDDFLQEQSGKTSFDSYEDVIAALTPGQGYAYIKLTGSEEEILAVTDLVFEADHSAFFASLYGKYEGKVKQLGMAEGNGSAYPLRAADGILYGGDNHNYSTYFIADGIGSIMMKDYITDGVNSGNNEFTGFTREKNSFEDSTDFTGGQEEFDKLLAEREKKPIIEFTAVE
ncbi:MAG: hypothetical protein II842_15855 [Butyrivibrio sp.]|nr:hypothetical protein [Butyrivibrio sp.]